MDVTIFSMPLGVIGAAVALVFGILGIVYLTAHYGLCYSAPVLILTGVAVRARTAP